MEDYLSPNELLGSAKWWRMCS